MKTLYLRIVLTMLLILLLAGIISLLISNVVYRTWGQPSYSAKVERTVETARSYFEERSDGDADAFYALLEASGYQGYVVRADETIVRFGGAFRTEKIDTDIISQVRSGEPYHGMRDYPFRLFWLGLFDQELTNTYGTRFLSNAGAEAVFIRPDLQAQIRELHLFIALFLGLATVLSFLFILLATRYLVKPLNVLTEATAIITAGDVPRTLPVGRGDEIGLLARRFADMGEAIARTSAERKRFVSNVSHEFQSPLTSLSGYAQKLEHITTGDAKDYAAIIATETRRLSGLTRQLLLLARLDEQRTSTTTRVSLHASIADALTLHTYALDDNGIAVVLDVPSDLTLEGDPILLAQVWGNLFANAINASTDGGMIRVEARHDDDIVVTFEDRGQGMDEETRSRLFERFYQGDTSRNHSGSGLGLAIVDEIVRLHKGTITVDSTPQKGTCFTLRFPKTNPD